jgi:hypothetical protein
MTGTPRLMMIIVIATGVVVIGVASLALESWLLFAVLMVLHGVASAAVIGYTFKKTAETGDKPDPVTEARIEEERSG